MRCFFLLSGLRHSLLEIIFSFVRDSMSLEETKSILLYLLDCTDQLQLVDILQVGTPTKTKNTSCHSTWHSSLPFCFVFICFFFVLFTDAIVTRAKERRFFWCCRACFCHLAQQSSATATATTASSCTPSHDEALYEVGRIGSFPWVAANKE